MLCTSVPPQIGARLHTWAEKHANATSVACSRLSSGFMATWERLALVMHTKLKVWRTRLDFQPSGEVEAAVRFVFEKSQEIQRLTKAKLPVGRKS